MLLLLLAAHAVVGALLLLGAGRLGRRAFVVGALPMLATLAAVATQWATIVDGGVVTSSMGWVPALGLQADARLDGFSMLMVLLVSGMGVLVLAYGASYFSDTARSGRIAGLLVLFAGSMLGLVLADNLGWLYLCWELTSVTSFLLISGNQATAQQRTAGLQALLVTGAGGLVMLAGMIVLAQGAGTWSLSELIASPPSGGTTGAGLALVAVGILTKSAQYPFHFWLPGAMVAATPISAYLHSATMVKAGIYLAARLAPAFATVGVWRPAMVTIGLVTMVAGGLRALRQNDLKLLLAFGTVSQLGFLLVLASLGRSEATLAACVLLLAHALFKGALFLVVGLVDHQAGTRDRRELPVLGRGWAPVQVIAVVSGASMAGLPPLLGFIAKEAAYEAFVHGGTWNQVALGVLVIGSALTFAYTVRFLAPLVRRSAPAGVTDRKVAAEPSPVPPALRFTAPAALLALGTLSLGLAAGPLGDDLIGAAATSLDPAVGHPHLKLWHGLNVPLLLSASAVALGVLLVLLGERLERVQQALAPPMRGDEAFADVIGGLGTFARRVTAVVQSGSQPAYLAIILLWVVWLPTLSALHAGGVPDLPAFDVLPAHVVLGATIAAGSIAVAAARRRFAAVLLLGAVGYAIALLFAVQGAPDLALTQFAVETLLVVVFVLVIRHLPEEFRPQRNRLGAALRLLVSAAVALGVFTLAMLTSGGSSDRPTSAAIVAQAKPEGGGANVVNVILVDVRGLDTLGEVTVLAVAAVGVTALARIGRRPTTGARS